MTAFEQLDQALGSNCADDYWSDEGVLHAEALVDQLRPEDWETLRTIWEARSTDWRHRFADVLSRAPYAEGADLLGTMLQSEDDDLVLTAAASLASFDEVSSHLLTPKRQARLIDLARKSSLNKTIVDDLLRKLSP